MANSALLLSGWSYSTETLSANPDATQKEGFLDWAEHDAYHPLPEYALASVVASWDTKTYRTTLEESIADKHTRLKQFNTRWIRGAKLMIE